MPENLWSHFFLKNSWPENFCFLKLFIFYWEGIGISRTGLNDPILGEDKFSYGLQIIQHPKVKLSHNNHRYQMQMNADEVMNATVLVEVNLLEKWMNIYVNGMLVCR